MRVVVEADGGARGNPGPAGYGAVVRDAGTGEVLAERSAALGVTTNNVAEYSGLVAGLRAALDVGASTVDVRMDSKLVVEQMSGRWQIKHPGLRPLAAEAAGLLRRFEAVTFTWVPRERNKHADALANAAMDSLSSAAAKKPSWEPPAGPATRLILVRHGATELTEQRRYSGRGDVPLSAAGTQQASATARRVSTVAHQVAAVVSSPLSRCTATASVIAAATGSPPVVSEPDLIECDFGRWEGLTFAEVRQRWPAEMDKWLGDTGAAPPDGESFQAVAKRVRRAVAGIRQAYEGRVVVVVSHVSPLKLLLRDALAASDTFLYRLYLDPGGLSIVDSWPDGGVAVRSVNETGHLSP